MKPESAPNSTLCPVFPSWETEIRGRSTPATWKRREQSCPSIVWNGTIRCPRFGIRAPFAARYLPPDLCIADFVAFPGSSPGGAAVSTAPLAPPLAAPALTAAGPPP